MELMHHHSVELEPLDNELRAMCTGQADFQAVITVAPTTQEEYEELLNPVQYTSYLRNLALTCSNVIQRQKGVAEKPLMNPNILQSLC